MNKMKFFAVITLAVTFGFPMVSDAGCSACEASSGRKITSKAAKVYEASKSGVEKPSIKPLWSGAKVGTWTMDYATALAKASAEGKYTLMYFSGMWWCPRCKELEKYVLTDSQWKKFVKDRGLYLTVIDHPARNGRGNWCWLWDASYRKSAKLTAEDSAAVIAERYGLQEELYDPLATRLRNATNYVVEVIGKGKNVTTNYTVFAEIPESIYHSVNYPGIIIFAPDGTEAGRFIPDTSETPDYTLAGGLQYCIDHVDAAINPTAINAWVGNRTLVFSQRGYTGYGIMTMAIAANGKVKVSGFLPNGSKFSNTIPFVTGANTCFVPVRFNKKDASDAFVIRINNMTSEFTIESESGDYSLVNTDKSGQEAPKYVKCEITGFPSEINGCAVVKESVPASLYMERNGSKFKSPNGIQFSYTQKTGAFKGTFKVLVLVNGKTKKVAVSVNGVFVGENALGQALPKGACNSAIVRMLPVDMIPVNDDSDDNCGECGL